MSDLDLCYMGATEALALFRARKLSPVELMKAVIGRAEKVNKKVNAFTFTHFDEALEGARKAEAKYARVRALAPEPSKVFQSASRMRAGSRASRPPTDR